MNITIKDIAPWSERASKSCERFNAALKRYARAVAKDQERRSRAQHAKSSWAAKWAGRI